MNRGPSERRKGPTPSLQRRAQRGHSPHGSSSSMERGGGGGGGYADGHQKHQQPSSSASNQTQTWQEEELAGRPAMIAMNQEDLPFLVSNDRLRTRSSRATSDKPRGNNRTGTFYSNCRTSSAFNRSKTSHSGLSHASSSSQARVRDPKLAASNQTSNQMAPRSTTMKDNAIGWRVAIDPKSKKPYYYHPITRETTWQKPDDVIAAETREKKHFFSVMENNIRLKYHDGYYARASMGQSSPDTRVRKPMSPFASTRSNASTASTRSSLSSYTSNSGRSLPGSVRQLLVNSTRSLPTTPEGMGVPFVGDTSQPQQEPRTSDDELKRPSLFRTLSSYETPVACRKGDTSCLQSGSSPIQERMRLAALIPRASDLEAYARAIRGSSSRPSSGRAAFLPPDRGSSTSALIGSNSTRRMMMKRDTCTPDTRRPPFRRANSTNSIYLRMGTMDTPDQDATIQCVATVLRAHMMEALDAPIRSDARFDVFITARDRQRLPCDELDAVASAFVQEEEEGEEEEEEEEMMLDVVPTLDEMAAFIKHVFKRAQMESECIIMSLVYVERLLQATSGFFQLRGENWRRLVFCSMVMASKVWDDLSMTNADFAQIWPEVSLKEMKELELVYLSAVEYKVRVSAVSYAKYYFHLRSMCATMGFLEAFDENVPLNLEGARKMQVLSEEYQERAKLMPVPRRRSVTITSTSGEEGQGGEMTKKGLKASPAASLEQLVRMQVRVAGGSSLGALHRVGR